MAGFLAGWISLLAGFSAPTAAAALGLQAYLGPSLGMHAEARWIATVAIVITSVQHSIGVKTGARLQNAIVITKLLGLLAFLVVGYWALMSGDTAAVETAQVMTDAASAAVDAASSAVDPASTGTELALASGSSTSSAFPIAAFAVSLVWISFSYSGWNAVVYIAGEIQDPQRNLQRSLLGGCLLVTALYLALNTLFLYAAPISELAGQVDVAAVAALHLGGDAFQTMVRLLIALALLTSISAMMMIGPRVYARMAEDGLFPGFFRARRGNFRHAILLQAVLALAVVWSSHLSNLLGYIGFTLGLSAAATVFAFMLQRTREGAAKLPMIGYPLIPILFLAGVLGSSFFLVSRAPLEALWGLLTVLSGLPIYWLMRARKAAPR